jgi:hypothetical protein
MLRCCNVAMLSKFFTKLITNKMYISINKQPNFFQNLSGFLSRIFQGKFKSGSLISNVSAVNRTFCRRQHFSRELRFERDWVSLYTITANYLLTFERILCCYGTQKLHRRIQSDPPLDTPLYQVNDVLHSSKICIPWRFILIIFM